MNDTQAAVHGLDTGESAKWSPAEKSVARKAFDLALKRELEAVISETKGKAARIRQVSDVWNLEQYLTKRRRQIDRQFDYRYSVLIQVFGELLHHRRRLTEEDLHRLSEDKIAAIRRYASFLSSPLVARSSRGEGR
jgi:hypothetical protein